MPADDWIPARIPEREITNLDTYYKDQKINVIPRFQKLMQIFHKKLFKKLKNEFQDVNL